MKHGSGVGKGYFDKASQGPRTLYHPQNKQFAPENGWLEDDISFWEDNLFNVRAVSFRDGKFQQSSLSFIVRVLHTMHKHHRQKSAASSSNLSSEKDDIV